MSEEAKRTELHRMDYVHSKLARDKRKGNREVSVLREEASELSFVEWSTYSLTRDRKKEKKRG